MDILSSRTLKRAAVVVAVTLATPATLLAASATPAAADPDISAF